MKLFSHPIGTDVFGETIQQCLREAPKGSLFRVAIAYISVNGAKKLEKYLKEFIDQNGTIEIIAGIDIGDGPVKGILEVLRICGLGSVFIFWNPDGDTFHPKVYCLTDAKIKRGSFWIGSSNFTEKGLFKNYECSIQLQVSEKDNRTLLEQINKYFYDLRKSPFCQPATDSLLKPLLEIEKKHKRQGDRLLPTQVPSEIRNIFRSKTKGIKLKKGFAMSLSHNDVSGKRSEPYFLIPVRARDQNPSFWGWPDKFSPSKRSGMPERHILTEIHFDGSPLIENRRLYWVEKRDEFRFVSPTIYQLGESYVGNILYLMPSSKGYEIYLIPPTDPQFSVLIKQAVNLSSHQKKWGYIT